MLVTPGVFAADYPDFSSVLSQHNEYPLKGLIMTKVSNDYTFSVIEGPGTIVVQDIYTDQYGNMRLSLYSTNGNLQLTQYINTGGGWNFSSCTGLVSGWVKSLALYNEGIQSVLFSTFDLTDGVDSIPVGEMGTIEDGQYVPPNVPVIGEGVTFISPSSGYKDTPSTWQFRVMYNMPVDLSAEKEDIALQVLGGQEGTGRVISHDFNFEMDSTGQRWARGIVTFERGVKIGVNTISFNVSYKYKTLANHLTVERFTGIVDEDGDGIDDRTGQPIQPPEPEPPVDETPQRDDYEDGVLGSISYSLDYVKHYITAPFRFIGESLSGFVEWLQTSSGWVASVSGFFGAIFAFLPAELSSALIMLFMVVVVFTVMRVMRG